jgi:hypothetical protein
VAMKVATAAIAVIAKHQSIILFHESADEDNVPTFAVSASISDTVSLLKRPLT